MVRHFRRPPGNMSSSDARQLTFIFCDFLHQVALRSLLQVSLSKMREFRSMTGQTVSAAPRSGRFLF